MKDDFVSWTYDPRVNAERSAIVLDLVRDIRNGTRQQGGRAVPHPAGADFENAVKATLFSLTENQLASPVAKKFYQPAGDTFALLSATITENINWYGRNSMICEVPLRNQELAEQLNQRFDVHRRIDIGDSGRLQDAFALAIYNTSRATGRLIFLHTVCDLIKLHEAPGFSALRADLWEKRVIFHREVLLFGALLGGDHLKAAVRLVAPTCIWAGDHNLKFSLIELLEVDGYSPGQYLSARVDRLEKDIDKAMKKLLS